MDPETIATGWRGGGVWRSKHDCRLSRHLLTFYRVFQLTIPSEQKFPKREGGPSFRRCGGRGRGGIWRS